mgnify:CR=1 FL=1
MDGDSDMPPAAIHDGSGSSMRRQDSSTSLATVNIGASSADGGVSFTGPGSFHYQVRPLLHSSYMLLFLQSGCNIAALTVCRS